MPISDTSQLGLVNRFQVTVTPGEVNLGSWAKVEGLDVTFDTPDYRAGDNPNFLYFCPGNTKYSNVRFIRATSKDDSPKVKKWLSDNALKFAHGEVKIVLNDAHHDEVMSWTLRDAIPKKWSINNFEAGGSSVAVETLEIIHGGFLDDEQSS